MLKEASAAYQAEIEPRTYLHVVPENPGTDAVKNLHNPIAAEDLHQYMRAIGRHELLSQEDEVRLARAIKVGAAARSILNFENNDTVENNSYQNSIEADTIDLEALANEGDLAREQFAQSNLRLAVSIAKKFTNHVEKLTLLDLIQEANIGLLRAVDKFDERLGNKFSTYATLVIRQTVARAIANKDRTIHVGARVVAEINELKKSQSQLSGVLGREATPQELAEFTGKPVKRIYEIRGYEATKPISLNKYTDNTENSERTLEDTLMDRTAMPVEERAMLTLDKASLNVAMQALSIHEQKVLELRFGLGNDNPRTLLEVGDEFGITGERIRQIQNKALSKLRNHSGFAVNPPY